MIQRNRLHTYKERKEYFCILLHLNHSYGSATGHNALTSSSQELPYQICYVSPVKDRDKNLSFMTPYPDGTLLCSKTCKINMFFLHQVDRNNINLY